MSTEIQLSKALLRPWRPGDAASMVKHFNNRKIWLNLQEPFPYPYTLADAETHLGRWIGKSPLMDWAIDVNDEAVGHIHLRLLAGVYSCNATIGYWLGEEFWGSGIATEAVGVVTAYAVERLGVLRVEGNVFGWNEASGRVLEKNGYVLEGRFKNRVFKDGQITDGLLYGWVKP